MNDFYLSYREVIPDQTLPEKWKEFTLNTGGTQSTLQDIKVPERANGYCYKDASKHHTRNRFIYWRISNDILELVEQSFDVNLSGNRVRFKFADTPILDGITIHEFYGDVIILVPTVCSVHRLTFPHPNKIHKQDEILGTHPDLCVPSIFSDISPTTVSDPSTFYVFNNPNSVLPHVAASFLNVSQEEGIFVFGYPSGEQVLVKQSFSGHCETLELKQETKVPRFLSGLAGALKGKSADGSVVVSFILLPIGVDIYAVALCRDGNLRIWSCEKGHHIAVSDVLADTADSCRQLMQGAQSHILRKSVDPSDGNITLGVFLSFSSECQFHILQPSVTGGVFKITRLFTLYSPEQDLMDFALDSKRLWAVWRDSEGECSVKSACLDNHCRGEWMRTILNPQLDPEYIPHEPDVDPKQAYVSFIFYPGRFPLSVITKALSIYRRSATLSDMNLSASVLKQRVCIAVETEIQTEAQEFEVSDMDYLEITNRCWSRFYSCCVQYYAASAKPLGLLLLPSVSGVVLLKKSMYSLLRPLDVLEQMLLCSETTSVEQFILMNHPQLSTDSDICSDLIQLMSLLVSLEEQLTEGFKSNIEREMAQLKSPDKVMSELVIDLIAGAENPILSPQFLWNFQQKLSNCNDLYAAMHLLLELLRIDSTKNSDSLYPNLSNINSKENASINHLFSSELGISVVSECLHQQAVVRFSICRNLLLLQNILLERRELEWGILEAIRSVCMPDTVVFMQAYYVITWISEQPTTPVTLLDTTIKRLAPLRLSPVFGIKNKNNYRMMTLLELFAMSTGGSLAHTEMKLICRNKDVELLAHWHFSMLNYVMQLSQLIWAVSGGLSLGEWLLASGQHLLLQRYVRLLNPWCEWNNCSRNFILAVALLNTGEFYKAQNLFLKASKGIFTEQFLADRLPNLSEDNSETSLVQYHLKVINLFELHGARDCAINIARTALSIANSEDPNIATLHSVMFVHHLALGHYEEAYDSLVSNPDIRRKDDNLRDLVKTLLDRKLLMVLLSFPYVDMADKLIGIVMARARACDGICNMFYDFMYAFHMQRDQLRCAGSVMYEQAYRLGQHNTFDSLELQVKCYLAAINCLSLRSPQEQWVLRPVDQGEEEQVILVPNEAGSDKDTYEEHKLTRVVKALDLQMIRKEYELAYGRLRLAKCNPETLGNQYTTAPELITLLTNMGVYKCALKLAKVFNLPYDTIFSNLTSMCICLLKVNDPDAWHWLVENDLADMPVVDSSPATVCWNLLQSLLEKYEEPGLTVLHKVVLQKIISHNAHIPYWIKATYKLRNPAELLRILIKSGRVIEATVLASQQIWAVLGKGKENFGYKQPLVPTAPIFCLPLLWYERLEQLLGMLAEKQSYFEKDYQEFKKLVRKYLKTANRVHNDVVKIGQLQQQEMSKT